MTEAVAREAAATVAVLTVLADKRVEAANRVTVAAKVRVAKAEGVTESLG